MPIENEWAGVGTFRWVDEWPMGDNENWEVDFSDIGKEGTDDDILGAVDVNLLGGGGGGSGYEMWVCLEVVVGFRSVSPGNASSS